MSRPLVSLADPGYRGVELCRYSVLSEAVVAIRVQTCREVLLVSRYSILASECTRSCYSLAPMNGADALPESPVMQPRLGSISTSARCEPPLVSQLAPRIIRVHTCCTGDADADAPAMRCNPSEQSRSR